MQPIIVNGYELDKEQTKCIIENKKYSLIIAGAGSGKTLTLIGKIKYLLENKMFEPDQICCISFTNESVKDLQNNIEKNCHLTLPTYTFHKLALHILEQEKTEYSIAHPTLLQEIIDDFFYTKCYGNETLQKIIFKKFSFTLFHNKNTWKKIMASKEFIKFKKTILTFLNLMKANGLEKKDLKIFLQNKKYQDSLLIIYTIYTLYETEKKNNDLIDFDDMMYYATKILKTKGCNLPFQLIIIDEFQDTSMCRFQLIQEIVKQNNASLCVVGDDYQSIYHFSGCDLNLFLHFKEYYPETAIYKLEKTYRNSNELIQTAGQFIQKNKEQMKKELTSPKHMKHPIIIVYYKNKNTVLEKIMKKISEEKKIMILGRNNFDLKNYTKNLEVKIAENNSLQFKKFPTKKINYYTIHKSKGLESDVVILLNVENGLYGIPTMQKEEKLLTLINPNFLFPYAEERRLFYVAITRTKNEIYLLVPKNNPSIFIKEIKHNKNVKIIHV